MSTLNNPFAPFDAALSLAFEDNIRTALAEDIGTGDWTAQLIPESAQVKARVVVREPAVLCGAPWFEAVMQRVDSRIKITWHVAEGDAMSADTEVCSLNGPARALMTGERAALNFLQFVQ